MRAQSYILGAGDAERQRLIAQSAIHEPEPFAYWNKLECSLVGTPSTSDVGRWAFSKSFPIVGATGKVVGLDNEPRMLEMARESVAELGLTNVELVQGTAGSSGLPRSTFDLAHARLLLVNVPDPEAVVLEMTNLVRPEGVVALQEVDWISWTCDPPHQAWDRLIAILSELRRQRDLDVYVGRRLPRMLRASGLVNVQVKAFAPIWKAGDLLHDLLLVFARLHREQIIQAGVSTEDELDRLIRTLGDHLSDPKPSRYMLCFFKAGAMKPRRS